MVQIGTRIEETGTLLEEAAGQVLRRDLGGRWRLDLHRVGSVPTGERVRVTGTIVDTDLIDVDGIARESDLSAVD